VVDMEAPSWQDVYGLLRLLEWAATRVGFVVREAGLVRGVPSLLVEPPKDQKKAFEELIALLKPHNVLPVLRRGPSGLVLRAVSFRPGKERTPLVPLILFVATFGSIFAAGWFLSLRWPEGPFLGALMFTGAMMAVLATHEMGHWIAARLHGVSVTPPYFIPAPPPISFLGTFGAFIQQKTPAPNKDALFDIGVAGPLAGFVAAIAITLVGLPYSRVVVGPVEGIPLPYILAYAIMIRLVLSPLPEGAVVLLHPVAFAGWVGMLVTMLNLIPAGSLDGGHIARCVLKAREHMFLGLLGALLVMAVGFLYGGWYLPMAILALLMAFFYRHPGPLDDESSLSPVRKAALVLPAAIFLLCIAPIPLPR